MIQYNVEIKEPEKPCTIEQIREFEQWLQIKSPGTSLPQEYIDYLLQYNGGIPTYRRHYDFIEPIDETETGGGVSWFYALYDGDVENIKKNYRYLDNRMPKDLFPIAGDPCGNDICIAISGPNYGKVYFWDHENEAPDGQEPWYDNVYLIANSFREFIDKLYEVELDENNNLIRVERV